MASKSAYNSTEKGAEIEELLDDLEKRLDRLKVMYEQYFLGIQKMAPSQLHTEAERRVRELQQGQIRNTALRYRFATLAQKYGAYNSYWRRTLRQIEQGRYLRDLNRVKREADRKGADIPEELVAAMPKRMRDRIHRDRAAIAELAERAGKTALADAAAVGIDDIDDAEPVVVRSTVPRGVVHALDPRLLDDVDDIDGGELEFSYDAILGLADDDDTNPIEVPLARPTAVSSQTAGSPKPAAPTMPASSPKAAAAAPAPTPTPALPPAPAAPPVAAPRPAPASTSPRVAMSAVSPPAATPVPPAQSAPTSLTSPLPPATSTPTSPLPRLPTSNSRPAVAPPPAPVPTPPVAAAPLPAPPAAAMKPIPAPALKPIPAPVARSVASPAPPPAAPVRASTQISRPVVSAAASAPPPGMSDEASRALYQQYLKARQVVGESNQGMTYDKLLRSMNKEAPRIMEQYKAKGVEFNVVIKDDKVILKAKPKKG